MPEPRRSPGIEGACRRAGALGLVSAALCASAIFVLMPILLTLIPSVPLAPFPDQNQTSETILYLVGFGLLLPAATFGSFRLERKIGDSGSFEGLAALLLGSLAVAVLMIRLATDAGLDRLAVTFAAGVAGLLVALVLAAREWRPDIRPTIVWGVVLALSFAAIATVVTWEPVSLPAAAIALLAGLALVWLVTSGRAAPELPRWSRIVIDLIVLALIVLAVPDTMIVYPEAALTDSVAAFDTQVIQFHQNLYLGAASQVLAGQAMLVGTVSQYGVASIYPIAAFFELVPIGHGTLGLLDGILTGFCFGAGYVTLRLAGVGRGISGLTLIVAVISLAWGSRYPEGALLQHGAMRFGLPMLLIPLAVAGFRWPRFRKQFKVASLLIVGLSAIWALEAFLYVAVTWVGIVVVSLAWTDRERRVGLLIREGAYVAIAVAGFHLAFALVTLVAAGSLPDWGGYLTYLREFLGGDVGDLTYDVVPFSPALAVAFAYFASAAGLVALACRRNLDIHPAAMVAIAGLTAYGIVLFSYFDNRSLGHILSYVCLPALLLSGLWLGQALQAESGFGRFAKRLIAVSAAAGAALLVGVAWPTVNDRAPDSIALVALPGGDSLRGRFQRLENLPPLVKGADEGESLVERYMPGDDPVPVLTVPDLDVNILVRSGRANALGITDAKEGSWVPGPHLDVLAERVAGLRPGQRMLVDGPALEAWRMVRDDPAVSDEEVEAATAIHLIQIEALRQISERFDLRSVARGRDGLQVVELVPLS